jgi:hypothetical protein
MAANLRKPTTPVISVAGEGGFLFTATELDDDDVRAVASVHLGRPGDFGLGCFDRVKPTTAVAPQLFATNQCLINNQPIPSLPPYQILKRACEET